MLEMYLYFIIYAFLGWCVEVIFAALNQGEFVNRGFFNGPYCPIYGLGVVGVISLLVPFQENLLILFLGSVLITSSIELIAGFLLEKIFHNRWWDYSHKPFNIGGYICPLFSLGWGIACVLVVYIIHPMISDLVGLIPSLASMITVIVSTFVLAIDLIITANTVFKLNRKLERIEKLSLMIKKSSDELGENLAEGTIAFISKKQEVTHNIHERKVKISRNIYSKKLSYADIAIKIKEQREVLENRKQVLNKELEEMNDFGKKRLLRAFPNLKSKRHKTTLKMLKDYINRKI